MKSEFQLDKRLYPVTYIQKAIIDYGKLAIIKIIQQNEKYVICQIECQQEDYEEIRKEFCNYLIDLISTVGR